jgi:hypothetical protein
MVCHPQKALWGRSESGPLEESTNVASHEDEGIGGSGQATERRKLRASNVCFLFKKPLNSKHKHKKWEDAKKAHDIPHARTGKTVANSPWYGPS